VAGKHTNSADIYHLTYPSMRSSLFGFIELILLISLILFIALLLVLPPNREKRIWVEKVLHSLI